MKSKLLTIGQASKMIGVSIQTLRRWDESGRLLSTRRKNQGIDIIMKMLLKNLLKIRLRIYLN